MKIKAWKPFNWFNKILPAPEKITVIYFIFGFLWIFFSDRVFLELSPTKEIYYKTQTIKGWFYVLITTLMIYSLLKIYDQRRKKAYTRVAESEQRYYKLSKLTSDMAGSYLVDKEWNLSPEWIVGDFPEALGYTREELTQQNFIHNFFHQEDLVKWKYDLQKLSEDNPIFINEYRMCSKEGKTYWMLNFGFLENNRKTMNQNRLYHAAKNISDHKQIEIELQSNKTQKDFMLTEIHHRVKNNLQVIISLMKLTQHQINDENSAKILSSMINRIYSISLVHESLYNSENFSKIDFYPYLKKMAVYLISKYNCSDQISIEIDMSQVFLSIKQAVPTAIIITELMENAIKHAYTGKNRGNIKIIGKKDENNEVEFHVIDDGIGFHKPTDKTRFGLRLIEILARQVNGRFKINEIETGSDFQINLNMS